MRRVAPALVAGLLLLTASASQPGRRVLDDFSDASRWTAAPSDGVQLLLSADTGAGGSGKALRMDFDFGGRAGWAAVRRPLPMRLPENWVIDLRLKGDTLPQTLEFKLLDASGENVWWSVRRPYEFPRDWTTLRIRKRQVSFAWGPAEMRGLSPWVRGLADVGRLPASGRSPPSCRRATRSARRDPGSSASWPADPSRRAAPSSGEILQVT